MGKTTLILRRMLMINSRTWVSWHACCVNDSFQTGRLWKDIKNYLTCTRWEQCTLTCTRWEQCTLTCTRWEQCTLENLYTNCRRFTEILDSKTFRGFVSQVAVSSGLFQGHDLFPCPQGGEMGRICSKFVTWFAKYIWLSFSKTWRSIKRWQWAMNSLRLMKGKNERCVFLFVVVVVL